MQRRLTSSCFESVSGVLLAVLLAVSSLGTGCGPTAAVDMSTCDGFHCNGGCDTDSDCATRPGAPKCDAASHQCVGCLADTDCGAGLVCGLQTHLCAPGCSAQKGCGSDGGMCELDAGICVGCLVDGDCKDPKNPSCDPASHQCYPCVPSKDTCQKSQYCAATGGVTKTYACAPGCKTSKDDCPPPAIADGGTSDGGANDNSSLTQCSPTTHQCVQCLSDRDCPSGKVCNQLGFCADGCNANQPCAGQLTCCNAQCIDTTKDTSNCGACGTVCAQGGNCCTGKCSDPVADADNCGGCGIQCVAANGTPGCKRSTCGVAFCNSGWADCNGLYLDGCETHTDVNVNNCGACNNVCSITNAQPRCQIGTCQIDVCLAPYADCNKMVKDGCEVDTSVDANNCSACGAACSANHIAAPACQNSLCVGACDAGFSDCNADRRTDGCETATGTDITNCGSCKHVCSTVNGTPGCDKGGCSITCKGLYDDCDKDVATGCETSLSTLINCGSCGTVCALPNANPNCNGGMCQITTCANGWSDCDKMPADGCEVHTAVDVMNCGGCGAAFICSSNNGTPSCVTGTCFISCLPGFADCNHDVSDGCETTYNDVNSCGGCGKVCNLPHVKAHACGAATCTIVTCETGWADCNGLAADGCEVNTTSDAANCGACQAACSRKNDVPACVGSVCKLTCNFGYADCDMDVSNGCEVNTGVDASNCGVCGAVCPSTNIMTPTCGAGACNGACNPGFADCNGNKLTDGCETSTATAADVNHCGACGHVCSSANGTPSCGAGTCTIACSTNYGNCDGDVSNGCETSLATDNNCGGCGVQCVAANATTTCKVDPKTLVPACAVTTCAPGYANCDGLEPNGCEVSTTTDANNCGACKAVCSNNHITMTAPTCAGGSCNGTCDANFADCNGNKLTDGCETSTGTDTNNCGTCGHVCSNVNAKSVSCAAGTCGFVCNDGFFNCSGDVRTGCETALNTNANCGSCGTPCTLPNATTNCNSGKCAVTTCAAGYAHCSAKVSDGCEVNIATDPKNCGGCGTVCTSTNGTPSCAGGACFISCAMNFGDCNHDASDGCETSFFDVNNCGGCGSVCKLPHVTTHGCGAGACTITTCQAGWMDCNGIAADGCEVNTTSDPNNCGACNAACSRNNDVPACVASTCKLTCNFGYADCNNKVADGCEANTGTDASNCGACGAVCSGNHITKSAPTCAGGSCNGACDPGFADCNGNKLTDGCETSTATAADVNHCGACGHVCSSANGTPSCGAGTCTIACSTNYGNCDGDVSNGCETSLATDNNCGGCGVQCVAANATTTCKVDPKTFVPACAVTTCAPGYANCDGLEPNGCEVNTTTDANNCGACKAVCSNNHITMTAPTCAGGSCNGTCDANFADCNGNKLTDGCETPTGTDTNNCGTCGHVCSNVNAKSVSCKAGTCGFVCNAGFDNCSGDVRTGCETALNTNANCGSCGTPCTLPNAVTNCNSRTCAVSSCAPGYAHCSANVSDGCEVNIATDANNCGACNHACYTGAAGMANGTVSCSSSTCSIVCNAGHGNCDGDVSNGCETDFASSPANCGACGTICSSNHIVPPPSCAASVCNGSCQAGYADCNANKQTDGCETYTDGNPQNCGGCNNVCSGNNVLSPTCGPSGAPGTGTCNGTCVAGFSDCNMNKLSDGCETNTNLSTGNCGGCGVTCSMNNIATPTCTNGTCDGKCNANTADCNGNKQTDGCEVDVLTDGKHCGNCATICPVNQYCNMGVCAPAAKCSTGNDPVSGAPWVICSQTMTTMWFSIANVNQSGVYHAGQICKQFGFSQVDKYGGNCGDVCGYCAPGNVNSCNTNGPETYDNNGFLMNDAYGPVLTGTVMWHCIP